MSHRGIPGRLCEETRMSNEADPVPHRTPHEDRDDLPPARTSEAESDDRSRVRRTRRAVEAAAYGKTGFPQAWKTSEGFPQLPPPRRLGRGRQREREGTPLSTHPPETMRCPPPPGLRAHPGTSPNPSPPRLTWLRQGVGAWEGEGVTAWGREGGGVRAWVGQAPSTRHTLDKLPEPCPPPPSPRARTSSPP